MTMNGMAFLSIVLSIDKGIGMKKSICTVFLFASAGGCASVSYAAGVSMEAGTTGAGAHLILPLIDDTLNTRLGANIFHFNMDGSTSDMDYQFTLKLQTVDVLLDYYPFAGRFRLTAGAVMNRNKIEAQAKTNSHASYTVNGHTYQASDIGSVDGRVTFNRVAPYAGIGWGNAVAKNKGFGLTSDIGVMYQGSAKTRLSNSDCRLSSASCAQLQQDIAAENAKLQDEVKSFKLYPVIRVGLTYQF